MKLIYSPTSPYARKTRMVILEKNIGDLIELVAANPLAKGGGSEIPNPLGKVPTLVLDDGSVLFDSPVICAYLDEIGDTSCLLPLRGREKWRVVRAQALGDGVLDAAFNVVIEVLRTDAEQSSFWMERWKKAIGLAVAEIADDLKNPHDVFDLGYITYACALGYLDFRLPEIDWRTEHPDLSIWHKEISARQSYIDTRPE